MIKLNSLVLVSEDGVKAPSALSGSYDTGISYLSYADKAIFDCLSFAFSDIDSGSFSIDGNLIAPNDRQSGKIYELAVSVRDVMTVTAVFILPKKAKDAFLFEKNLANDVRFLHDMPATSDNEKKAKLTSLLLILEKYKAAYLLIDLNDTTNLSNRALILNSLLDRKDLTVFILDPRPEEKAFLRQETYIPTGVWSFIKKEVTLLVGIALSALLSCFGIFWGLAFSSSGKPAYGVPILLIGILLYLFVFYQIGILSLKSQQMVTAENQKLEIETWLAAILLVAIGLAAVISYLLIHKGVYVLGGVSRGISIGITGLFVAVLFIASLGLSFVGVVYQKIKSFFKKS